MPKKSLLFIVIILATLALVSIWYINISQSSKVTETSTEQNREGQILVNLSQLNNSGESGTAVLEEQNGYVVVTLNLTGSKKDAVQPAHLHAGDCPGLGSVKYPLKNVVNGTSVTTLNLTLVQLQQELPIAINVHESTDNFKSYMACGEISLP